MTRTQKLIALFWVFIGGMLIWQFSSYNHAVVQQAIDHPKPAHYFFDGSSQQPDSVAPSLRAANVQQIGFLTQNDTPSAGSFTAQVILKNVGNTKATGVQVFVRPYRGILVNPNGRQRSNDDFNTLPLSENDPLSQFGQWVTFPDLDPGQENTQNVIFLSRSGIGPGKNPQPQIIFETERAKP